MDVWLGTGTRVSKRREAHATVYVYNDLETRLTDTCRTGGQIKTDGYNWDAFGNSVSRFGVNPTAFAWNVSSGYQSDGDSGLKLLGHRYYDSRTGRFISQDPAGDGDNWYAYADNDPMDEVDPDGLMSAPTGAGMWSVNGGDQTDFNSVIGNVEGDAMSSNNTWAEVLHLFLYRATDHHDGRGYQVDGEWPLWNSGGMGGAMFASLSYHGYTPTEVHKIKHLINIINKTSVGHALIKKAVLSSKDYKIIKNRGMPFGTGRTGETYFNLDWHTWINTVDGGRDASSLRILAHEFGHSIGGYSDSYDPANSNPGNFMMNVDHVENPIMTFLDGPGAARTTYP